jgi:sialate O-acetylesterase
MDLSGQVILPKIAYLRFTIYTSMKKLLFLLLSFSAFSDVKLPSLVSNGMVLQRDIPVKIWGWANPGEKVTVNFKGKKIRTSADAMGNWSAAIPATPAGGPYEIQINEIRLQDVLFGDVWLCSGQ